MAQAGGSLIATANRWPPHSLRMRGPRVLEVLVHVQAACGIEAVAYGIADLADRVHVAYDACLVVVCGVDGVGERGVALDAKGVNHTVGIKVLGRPARQFDGDARGIDADDLGARA